MQVVTHDHRLICQSQTTHKKTETRNIVTDMQRLGISAWATVFYMLDLSPYRVVRKIGDMDYSVEIEPGKVKTYHINMLE